MTPTSDDNLQKPELNLEDAFQNIFKSNVSGTGEEELLRIASDYALQITAAQVRCLLYLEHKAAQFEALATTKDKDQLMYEWSAKYLHEFVFRWLELKRHNNSDQFVMRGLDSISLRKFMNENTLKIDVQK